MAGRVRRTNAEIDNTVMTELEKLVIKSGFGNVLVSELMANARLDPPVFYRRYGSIDNLYDKLCVEGFGSKIVLCDKFQGVVLKIVQQCGHAESVALGDVGRQ